jgi:hypothetical protein
MQQAVSRVTRAQALDTTHRRLAVIDGLLLLLLLLLLCVQQ